MTKPPNPQPDKFRDLARKLERDEDEACFGETVKKVATSERSPAPEKKADD